VNYMISNDDVVPKGVCNLPLDNVPDSAYLHIGRAQAGTFPDDACFKMDPDFPKNGRFRVSGGCRQPTSAGRAMSGRGCEGAA
jgi:hypothetical protein